VPERSGRFCVHGALSADREVRSLNDGGLARPSKFSSLTSHGLIAPNSFRRSASARGRALPRLAVGRIPVDVHPRSRLRFLFLGSSEFGTVESHGSPSRPRVRGSHKGLRTPKITATVTGDGVGPRHLREAVCVGRLEDQVGGPGPRLARCRRHVAAVRRLAGAGSASWSLTGRGSLAPAWRTRDTPWSRSIARELIRDTQRLAADVRAGSLQGIAGDFYAIELDGRFDVVAYFDGFGIGTDDDPASAAPSHQGVARTRGMRPDRRALPLVLGQGDGRRGGVPRG
jgi:hypothetical protein